MTKKQAIQEAKARRAAGEAVKVFCHSGVYTQPGKGVVTFCNYFVKTV